MERFRDCEIEEFDRETEEKGKRNGFLDMMQELEEKDGTMYTFVIGVIGAILVGTGVGIIMETEGALFTLGAIIESIGAAVIAPIFAVYQRRLEAKPSSISLEDRR